MLDEVSKLKPTISQLVETMKTNLLFQKGESDVTPRSSVDSESSEISLVVTPDGDQAADMDVEHVEKVITVAAIETKNNRESGL